MLAALGKISLSDAKWRILILTLATFAALC